MPFPGFNSVKNIWRMAIVPVYFHIGNIMQVITAGAPETFDTHLSLLSMPVKMHSRHVYHAGFSKEVFIHNYSNELNCNIFFVF